MRPNTLRKLWEEGRPIVNGWLAIPSSVSAELMGRAGWDSVTVDLQHGLVDYSDAVPMLQALSQTDVVPMARVPWFEAGIVGKMLDAGAYGIICPMINTRAECEAFVGACKYAPVGYRSVGPTRAVIYAGDDYIAHSNKTTLAIAMIETTQAIENLDEILTTPGLDGIYVGPADLAQSMGKIPAGDPTDEDVVAAIKGIADKAKEHGIPAGIHCGSPEGATTMIGRGYRLVTVGSDGRILALAAKAAVDKVKGNVATKAGGGSGPY